MIFVLVSFIRELSEGNIHLANFNFYDPDFSSVAGAFALSFLIHPILGPIIKKNIQPKNNQRDLFYGYCLTASIYFFVGFVGSFTCATSVKDIIDHPNQYNTVFDCVKAKESTE
eukprot:GHVR01084081.1.p1 GENE.GHVR01084081.1~~GHVR01084081.1.p1  ORF type:complete len:114 (+),score=3.97 GHVR01084081.1:1847-2188(+)